MSRYLFAYFLLGTLFGFGNVCFLRISRTEVNPNSRIQQVSFRKEGGGGADKKWNFPMELPRVRVT